jgi:hypothetical protein
MQSAQLIETLSESFLALSDEVQSLIDRKTILEHKLRYAHEQVCLVMFSRSFPPALVMILFSSRSRAAFLRNAQQGRQISHI